MDETGLPEAGNTSDAAKTFQESRKYGCEQGDALVPGLFCVTLGPALLEIQSRLAPGRCARSAVEWNSGSWSRRTSAPASRRPRSPCASFANLGQAPPPAPMLPMRQHWWARRQHQAGHAASQPGDRPARLKEMSADVIQALRPMGVDPGPHEPGDQGYRVHTKRFFSLCPASTGLTLPPGVGWGACNAQGSLPCGA